MATFGGSRPHISTDNTVRKAENNSKIIGYSSNPISTSKSLNEVIKPDDLKRIIGKIVYILRKMPQKSKMKNPVIISVEGNMVGFSIDKTKTGKVNIILKDGINSIENWSQKLLHQTCLTLTLDESGRIITGKITVNKSFGVGDYITYIKGNDNTQKLYFNSKTYVSDTRLKDSWMQIEGLRGYDEQYIENFNPTKLLYKCNFGIIMSALINRKFCLR